MTNQQFEALVSLMRSIAYVETGRVSHQQRAGDIEDDIDEARSICVDHTCEE
jgi:hypothetical protein